MLWLYIILGIILFLFILLMLPIDIKFTYDNEMQLSIRYLFIPFNILPQKEKSQKQLEKKEKKNRKKAKKNAKEQPEQDEKEKSTFSKIKSLLKEKGVDSFFCLIYEVLKSIKNAGRGILRNITIKKLVIKVSIGDTDPYQTAISYGKMCSAIFPAGVFVIQSIKTKVYNIQVVPNFEFKELNVQADIHIKIRPLILAGTAIVLVFRLFKNILKFILKNKNSQE